MIGIIVALGALGVVGGGLAYFIHDAFGSAHEAGYREAEKMCVAQIADANHVAEQVKSEALAVQGQALANAHDSIAEATTVAAAAHRTLEAERAAHAETRSALADEQEAHAETRANMCHSGCTIRLPD